MAKASDKDLAQQTDNRRYNFLRIWNKRYYHMHDRQRGIASHQSSGAHGKDILTQSEFLEWCKEFDNLQAFITLYFDWAANGFNRWDSPSIDRIDPTKGYIKGNLQWLSFGDNCEKNNKDPITHKELRYAGE